MVILFLITTSSLFTLTYYFISAGVAELADALDSDSNGSNTLWVQVPFSAPTTLIEISRSFFIYINLEL